jgi:hypothetical protein
MQRLGKSCFDESRRYTIILVLQGLTYAHGISYDGWRQTHKCTLPFAILTGQPSARLEATSFIARYFVDPASYHFYF